MLKFTSLGLGGGAGRGPSTNDAVGCNADYAESASLTGVSDGKSGVFSCWFKILGNDANLQYLFSQAVGAGAPYGLFIYRDKNDDLMKIAGYNAAGASILSCDSVTTFDSATNTGWHHLLISWDLAVAGSFRMYIDDVDESPTETTYTDDTLDYTKTRNRVLDDAGFAGAYAPWNGEVFDFWLSFNSYLDFDVAANRREFIDATGKPVDLGSDGTLPGITPAIYMALDDGDATYDNWATNRGTAGTFTLTGALAVATDSPND